MTILLGLDFETSGLDPKTSRVIEVGAVLWETNHIWGGAPLEMFSCLVAHGCVDLDPLPPEIMEITGIDHFMIQNQGVDDDRVLAKLDDMAHRARYIVAHNAPFEQSMLTAWAPDWERAQGFRDKPWIDTKTDIPKHVGKRLIHAAAEEGMVNPFPHRALPDVLTMLTLLSKFDFAEIERNALAQTVRLEISFSYDADRVAAVKAIGGWRWDSAQKCWFKEAKEFAVAEEIEKAEAAGFKPFVVNKLIA